MRPNVYVTQIPNRRDKATGALVPTFDISPASEHGEIRLMLPGSASFFATADMVKYLREALADYDFNRGDSLMAAGDPSVIATAGAIIAERSRKFRILKWDKNISRYVSVEVHL